jgi:YHS domain-containing protein
MKDPVCGMDVNDKKRPVPTSTYKGQEYAFCRPACKEKFDKNPEQYIHTVSREHEHEKAIK